VKTRRSASAVKLRALAGTLVGLVLAILACGRDEDSDERGLGPGELISALRAAIPQPELEVPPPAGERRRGPRFFLARVQDGEKVELLDRPGGAVVATLGDRTQFGSSTALAIVRAGDRWLGVTTPELGNGELGWVSQDDPALELYETRFSIVADLSARRLDLRHGRRLLDQFPITVGSAGSPTPLGRYGVTDALAAKLLGPYYGCCILALSGHQPNLPPGWLGGDRIAIHGTPGAVGGAASSGCLRASNDDMVSLFARVPLGVPVFIRA
jgi:L,D-transpeptidase catalytic domain